MILPLDAIGSGLLIALLKICFKYLGKTATDKIIFMKKLGVH
jgi:hypothetical protein